MDLMNIESSEGKVPEACGNALSRRSFVELTVGAITMLPAAAGGFAITLEPEQAYAADSVSPATKIVIAKPNETGFAVADVTGGSRVPIAGAKITLTSNENKKSISGTTGEDGVWLADLSKIASPVKDANGVDTYSAQVAITLEKDGYRSFETGWLSVKGGAGFDLPTQKIGDELAYPKRVTLSDWDILYTNNEFAVTPANDETHEIKVVFASKVAGEVSASLVASKQRMNMMSSKATATKQGNGYIATVSLQGAFLLKNHGHALFPNDQYTIDYTVGGKSYSAPIRLRVTEAPTALTAPFAKKMSFAPFGDAAMKLSLRFPSWVPLVAGKEVQLWKPDLPIDICFDPYGYFRASLRTPEWGYKSKDGKVDGNAWKTLPRKSFSEQYTQAKSEMASYAMKSAAFMVNSSRSTFDAFEHSRTLKVAFSAEAAIAGRWSDNSNAFRCKGELRGMLNIAFSIAKQLFAGPVPIVLQFDLNTHASIGVGCGIIIPYLVKASENGWSTWEYDFASTGVNFTLRIAPALSAGLGIKGVASISLQGMLAFTVFVGAGPLPKGGKETNPHAIIGLTAKVNVVIQMMFFTIPVNLKTYDLPKLYDNWDPDKLYAQAETDWFASAAATNFDGAAAMDLGDGLAEMEGDGVSEDGSLTGQSDDAGASLVRYEVNTEGLSTEDGLAYGITTFDTVQDVPLGDVGDTMFTAESSPDLKAQNANEDTVLRAQDAVEDAVPQYASYGTHDYAPQVIENVQSHTRLGANSGIVPGARQRIAKGVVSDPRVKIVSVYGRAVMFRLAAVKVNGKVRTRIVGQMLQTTTKPAGPICVFDFDPKIKKDPTKEYGDSNKVDRNDLWDYDFDVAVLSLHGSYQSIQFFVISGTRDNNASLGQVASDVVFQHIRFDVRDERFDNITCSSHGVKASNYVLDFAKTGTWYHNFSCPHIQFVKDRPDNKENVGANNTQSELFFTFLIRSAQSPDKVMSSKSEDGVRVSIGFSSAYVIASEVSYAKFLMFDLSNLTSNLNDPTVYELTCTKRLRKNDFSGWSIVSLRGAENVHHYGLLITAYHREKQESGYKNLRTRVLEAKLWGTSSAEGYLDEEDNTDLFRLVDWPAHEGQFLASVDSKLQSATFSGESLQPTYKQIGSDEFAVSSFGLDPSGTILYYPTVREGSPGYKYATSDGSSDIESAPMPEIKQHCIMACRMRDGKFSDPFVFAEVEYDMDNLAVVNVSSDFIGFISTDVLDAGNGTADLYYTAFPFVKCANVIGCEAVTPLAFPGSEAVFDLTVRNDGNTFISGFTAQIMEKGGKSEGSKQVVFSKDTLQESNYNPSENGKLKDVEDDYALAPGKTSVYRVSLTIPKGWTGKKSVCVKATDVVVAPVKVSSNTAMQGMSDLSAQADPDETDGVAEEGWHDGDIYETYGYDDSGAYEYEVGSNKGDYDEENGGEPYDVIQMEGENTFFDNDDFDDDEIYDEDDYNLQLDDAPIKEVDAFGNNAMPEAASPARLTLPKTSDTLGGLLGVAALAGAALAAYSARRAANEKKRDEEAESE